MFRKKKPAEAAKPDDEDDDDDAKTEVDEESQVELKKAALAPKGGKGGGLVGFIVGAVVVTAIAGGGGVLLGQQTAATIERAIAEKEEPPAAEGRSMPSAYKADVVVRPLEPVITNLASPSDTWIRLETAMIFGADDLENPDVAAAELRQDMLAYLRTISIAQLDGPSALQHLREDLNERARLRTEGQVSELIIETLIVQ
jgi:flagellar FliL protein